MLAASPSNQCRNAELCRSMSVIRQGPTSLDSAESPYILIVSISGKSREFKQNAISPNNRYQMDSYIQFGNEFQD